ncbi:hypothetical protein VHEMI09060 [[Torrubiella] hemipterigena]|uniref:FAD/NAD(P)-binding domain-containing protein n=1 Tax=[Torrubiella] hemipterigena TaxID=1531966 RepID=A0A0A1T8N2_9HYPO|nr:hypothetical protein VHEMI09060 [[Torrubiella] hemipterigena]
MVAKERVVIIGSGWAGYRLAYGLDTSKFQVIVISPESTLALTPLLASAACGLFDPRLAHEPIRSRGFHGEYIQAEVLDVDFVKNQIICRPNFEELKQTRLEVSYDRVVLAPGCRINTFGIPGVSKYALFVKNVAGANAVRSRLNAVLEMASLPGTSAARQQQLLHVVVVGGGPTGIEVAAELTDIFAGEMLNLYPQLAGKASISVHDVAPQILAPFDKQLAKYATEALAKGKVDVKVNSHITSVSQDAIETREHGSIRYGMLIWATGNTSVPLVDTLRVKKTAQGMVRILTSNHLGVLDEQGSVIPNAFALGDAADIEGGTLPTTAQVAVQKADYLIQMFNDAKSDPDLCSSFSYKRRVMVTYTGSKDGIVQGERNYTGYTAWLGWRAGNFIWVRSWRRKFFLCFAWLMDYLNGRELVLH